MKTEINVLNLSGLPKEVEDVPIKQSRKYFDSEYSNSNKGESYKFELWQFMIISIIFLIIGSAMRLR